MELYLNKRSLIGFCLVLLVHALIFVALYQYRGHSLTVSSSTPKLLQYVSIFHPAPSAVPSLLKSTVNKPEQMQIKKVDLNENATASAPARLDLDTLHADAVAYELNRQRSPIELQQEKGRLNRSLEARLEKGTEKAQRADCRTAYARNGLLAPLFIAADMLNDKGCRF